MGYLWLQQRSDLLTVDSPSLMIWRSLSWAMVAVHLRVIKRLISITVIALTSLVCLRKQPLSGIPIIQRPNHCREQAHFDDPTHS